MIIETPFYEEATFVVESNIDLELNSSINHIYPTDNFTIGLSDTCVGRKLSLVFHGDACESLSYTINFAHNISTKGDLVFTTESPKVIILELLNIGFNTWVECYRSEVLI